MKRTFKITTRPAIIETKTFPTDTLTMTGLSGHFAAARDYIGIHAPEYTASTLHFDRQLSPTKNRFSVWHKLEKYALLLYVEEI